MRTLKYLIPGLALGLAGLAGALPPAGLAPSTSLGGQPMVGPQRSAASAPAPTPPQPAPPASSQ